MLPRPRTQQNAIISSAAMAGVVTARSRLFEFSVRSNYRKRVHPLKAYSEFVLPFGRKQYDSDAQIGVCANIS